tara:strand:- start:13409 stop:13933 length:525 start_codon:yes stop_codon:yes gene_type:complete
MELCVPNSSAHTFRQRVAMLGIDRETLQVLSYVYPFVSQRIDSIIERFYAHMLTFPEGRRIFEKPEVLGRLRQAQRQHWLSLFDGDLSAEYRKRAQRIGQVHYAKGVAPYLYIAGYNFFQCEILSALSERYRSDLRLAEILTAVTRVVSLDMDLSISVYTRELWRDSSESVMVG